jgi:FixJ family two-component response regulator
MAAAQLISIVDDDPSMLEALMGLVRSLGYDVRGFASAEDFLASTLSWAIRLRHH